MRKRYQTGHIFSGGRRRKVRIVRYLEPVLENGKVRMVLRAAGSSGLEVHRQERRTHDTRWLGLVYAGPYETLKRQEVEELGNLIFPGFSQLATSIAT